MRYGTAAARWVIVATVLGSGMAAIDATIVGIALPTIGRQFHASVGVLQWVVTGYTLSLAALLLLGGALGDRFGRRRLYCIGVVWFAVASGACALSPSATTLIAMRVLQGVGAALLTPGSLAILEASFVPQDRGRAIGAWSGLGGVATAAGPLLGGYLLAAGSWRWIFVINAPIAVLVLFLSVRFIPESRDPRPAVHVDVAGTVAACVTLGALTFGLIEGHSRGWNDAAVLSMLALSAVAGAAFVWVERNSDSPMLPLTIFRRRQFSVTNAVTFIVYAALGGALFLLPVELQVADHYSPLASGVSLLPLTVIMLVLSARSGRLASRIGPRLQMSVGPVVVGAGLALLARATLDGSYASGVLPGVVVFGFGLAITVAPLTATALGALPERRAGLASAVNNDVARCGSLLAVAVLPSLVGLSGSAYLHARVLSSGFRSAVFIAAGMCAAGGLLAAVGLRNPERRADHAVPGEVSPRTACLHCALDAAPLTTSA